MLTGWFLFGALILFTLGTIFGSFLSVVILRSMRGESWVSGSSRCDECGQPIRWYDNIPLLSFIMLRGECRRCHKPIHPLHFVVELLTGVLFVWWYSGFFLFFQLAEQPFRIIQPLFWLAVAVILLVIFFTDLLYMIIPDEAVAILLVLVGGYRFALVISGIMRQQDMVATLLATVAAIVAFLCLYLITKGRGFGFGDVKLIAPLGLLLGWPNTLVMVFLAFVFGALVGIFLLLLGKRTMKQPIPFGPFLIAATFLSLIWGDAIFQWYLQLIL